MDAQLLGAQDAVDNDMDILQLEEDTVSRQQYNTTVSFGNIQQSAEDASFDNYDE